MGYIQQSNTKKIYAYLTQTGKEKIITGDTMDFQIKYFSLHDDDINYKIASKISGTTYNIPKTGFIPDITGDEDICLPHISDATFLEKNQLIYNPFVPPQITIIPGCTDPTALNYNPLANQNDGSCIPKIFGCTDPTALNYNSQANVDDGSCTYQTPPLTATVSQACPSANYDEVILNVTNPQGGSGGPYKWKVIAIANGTPISSTDQFYQFYDDYLLLKDINSPFTFGTVWYFGATKTDIFYKVYLVDTQTNNEALLFTSTLICREPITAQENLRMSLDAEFQGATAGYIGGSNVVPGTTNIPTDPPFYATVDYFLYKDDYPNTPISTDSYTNAYFKLEKVGFDSTAAGYNPAWEYVDIVLATSSNPFFETPINSSVIFEFDNNTYGNVTAEPNNVKYKKRVPIKVKRLAKGTTKPTFSNLTDPLQQNGSIKLRLYTDYGNTQVVTADFTLSFAIKTWS